MTWWLFVLAALLLGVERIAYALICRDPERFQASCAASPLKRLRNPVRAVRELFLISKLIQAATFAAWIYLHNAGSLWPPGNWLATTIGAAAIVVGQVLNLGVFLTLGTTGVFYGSRFGVRPLVPRISLLARLAPSIRRDRALHLGAVPDHAVPGSRLVSAAGARNGVLRARGTIRGG